MHKYARDAYTMGIRYIGGCCGTEPYHIRAVAEEVRFAAYTLISNVKDYSLFQFFIVDVTFTC